MSTLTSTHLFAGGGADGRGFDEEGYEVTYGANHDEDAVATLRANWPRAAVFQADINHLQMWSLPDTDVIVASPICTEATPSAGNVTPQQQLELPIGDTGGARVPAEWVATRLTALDITRAVEAKRPRVVVCENVPAFATRWRLFNWWIEGFGHLDYRPHIVCGSAAHFDGDGFDAAPQDRNRMIAVFVRRDVDTPDLRVTPRATCSRCGEVRGIQRWTGTGRRVGYYGVNYTYVCPNRRCGHQEVTPVTRPVADVLDLDQPGPAFGDGVQRTGAPYCDATRARVETGINRFSGQPFITILRNNCTVSPITAPLTTVTTSGNHHYLTVPGPAATVDGCRYRRLTTRERARVQGLPDRHLLCGNSTAQARQIGNGVPVNVARWAAARVKAVLG